LAEVLALAFRELSQAAAAALGQAKSEDFFHAYDIVIHKSRVKRRRVGQAIRIWFLNLGSNGEYAGGFLRALAW
jgi:hypothetical protein